MGYAVAPDRGLSFSLPGLPNCKVFFANVEIGDVGVVGTAPVGSDDYDSMGPFFWGPAVYQSAVTAAGSEGAFLISQEAAINRIVRAYATSHPLFAPVTGVDISTDEGNVALEEYFEADTVTDSTGTYITMNLKPGGYNPGAGPFTPTT